MALRLCRWAIMRECKLCDREATTAPEFHDYTRYDQNGNYSEWLSKYDILWIPEFELTCKDCLRLIIRAIYLTRTAGYGGTSRMTEQDFYNRDL